MNAPDRIVYLMTKKNCNKGNEGNNDHKRVKYLKWLKQKIVQISQWAYAGFWIYTYPDKPMHRFQLVFFVFCFLYWQIRFQLLNSVEV